MRLLKVKENKDALQKSCCACGVGDRSGHFTVSLAQTNSEDAAIREVVGHYFRGLKFNDVESLKKAFYPEAKLFFMKRDGTMGQLSQEQWYKGFSANAGKEEKGDLKIASLDVTGNAASVKVVEVYDTSKYTDYSSLLKFPDGWGKKLNDEYSFGPGKQ